MKNDIAKSLTIEQLKKQYRLDSKELIRAIELERTKLNKVENELNNYINAVTKDIENLQNQVDGNITTWFLNGVPSIENKPANEWLTNEEKNNHLGDLYYDGETGYAYRFALENNVYKWLKITDLDVTEALALANSAKDTADSKRRVFVNRPIPPYDNGDMWVNNGEIWICQISKPINSIFENSDFTNDLKYTDDTLAEKVDNKLTVVSGRVSVVEQCVDEISQKVEENKYFVDSDGNKQLISSSMTQVVQNLDGLNVTVSKTINNVEKNTTSIETIDGKVTNNTNQISNLKTTDTSNTNPLELKNSAGRNLIELKIDGVSYQETNNIMSSSEHPSEIKSLGYENVFNFDYLTSTPQNVVESTGSFTIEDAWAYTIVTSENVAKMFKANTTYTISADVTVLSKPNSLKDPNNSSLFYFWNGTRGSNLFYDYTKNDWVVGNTYHSVTTFTTPSDLTGYKILAYNYLTDETSRGSLRFDNLIVAEGLQEKPFISHGKYGIEAIITGKNLLNVSYYNANNYVSQKLTLKAGTYSVYYDGDVCSGLYIRKANASSPISGSVVLEKYNLNRLTFTLTEDDNYYIQFYKAGNGFTTFENAMLVKDSEIIEYEPYKEQKVLFVLDEPLRSLPNGVKDRLYLENNTSYVDRKVGSKIFDGSDDEDWFMYGSQPVYFIKINDMKNTYTVGLMSNYFIPEYADAIVNMNSGTFMSQGNKILYFKNSNTRTLEEFKTWLSTHNVQVDYELEEEKVIGLGEVSIPTLKGDCTIEVKADLEPSHVYCKYYLNNDSANYFVTKEEHSSSIEIVDDKIINNTNQINTLTDTLGNYYTQEQINQLIQSAENGLTNVFQTTGGLNIFRNTSLAFIEGNGYEFWQGNLSKGTEEQSATSTCILLQNGTCSQGQVVLNGEYSVSFKYKRVINLAKAKVYVNNVAYDLEEKTEETEFNLRLDVRAKNIEVRFECDTDNGYAIYELMVNSGPTKAVYSQNQNEITTNTVNISKGVEVINSNMNTKTRIDADGQRTINVTTNEVVNKNTDQGSETKTLLVKEKAEIVKTNFNRVENQTWISFI